MNHTRVVIVRTRTYAPHFRISSMLLLGALTAAALLPHVHVTAPLHSFGVTPLRSSMRTYRMQFGSQLPPEVSVVLKPSYAGASRGGKPMVVGTEAELRAIWNAMIKVYGNRDDALTAVRKNQQVIVRESDSLEPCACHPVQALIGTSKVPKSC